MSEETETETAFTIHLNCENCSFRWERGVQKGKKIYPRSYTRHSVKIADESITGGMKRGTTEHISCPNCETHSQVNVEDREPE